MSGVKLLEPQLQGCGGQNVGGLLRTSGEARTGAAELLNASIGGSGDGGGSERALVRSADCSIGAGGECGSRRRVPAVRRALQSMGSASMRRCSRREAACSSCDVMACWSPRVGSEPAIAAARVSVESERTAITKLQHKWRSNHPPRRQTMHPCMSLARSSRSRSCSSRK